MRNFVRRSLRSHCEMPQNRWKSHKELQEEESFDEMEAVIEIQDNTNQDQERSFSEEEDYDDDPILESYDVFFNNQLKDHIFLLQYPIRNPDEQYVDDSAPLSARIKPNEGSLELDVPIDDYSLQGKESKVKATSNASERQRLGGKPQKNQASYFMGVMRGSASPSSCNNCLYFR